MKKINFIFLLLLCSNIRMYSQAAGYAIFTPQNQSKAYLHKYAIGEHIVDSIVNDSANEVFYVVSIEKSRRKRAFVHTFVDDDLLTAHSGWIDWNNLGIRLDCCDSVYIRVKPNRYARIVRAIDTLYEWGWGNLFPVKKAKKEWLYIVYIDNKNKKIKGWLAPEHQCANSYTTCN